MSNRRFTIIIPTLNEEERIEDLLAYLKECAGKIPHEIIIADGGSTDNTLAIAEKFDVIICHCKRKGRAVQMNEGAEKATGSILYFIHADTLPPENFIFHILKAVQEGYGCGCFQLTFDDPHPILKFYSWFTRFPFTVFRFGDQSLFVKAELFRKVGGFTNSMVVMEDQKIVSELKKKSDFKVLNACVVTSARRYKKNGRIRLQAVYSFIVLLYYLGAGQKVLADIYTQLIHAQKNL